MPKKIKYRKCIFEYEEEYKDYFTKNGIIPTTFDTNGIFRNIFLDYNNCLNDEVEIIEEDKKIYKLDWVEGNTFNKIQENSYLSKKEIELLDSNFKELGNKINEIIDKLNEMEKE